MLNECLDSLSNLKCPDGCSITVMVVDNSENGSAEEIVSKKLPHFNYPIIYVTETARGIVCMRNKALEAAGELEADYLAFMDDDEVCSDDWIVQLYSGLKKHGAQVAQGTTLRLIPDDISEWLKRNRLLKLRKYTTGTIRSSASTRNVMFDYKYFEELGLKFNMAFNLMGSSDSFFFKEAYEMGAKIVWIDEARVTEILPKSRMNFKWIAQRAFRAGHAHFERISQANDGMMMFLEVLKKFFYLWFMAIIALIVFPYSKSLSVKIFRLSIIAFGFFRRAFGFNYLEYSKLHGE